MNIEELKKVLADAYRNIREARLKLFEAISQKTQQDRIYQAEANKFIHEIKPDKKWKNISERDAAMEIDLYKFLQAVNRANDIELQAKLNFDLASYTLEEARALLRIAELTKEGG